MKKPIPKNSIHIRPFKESDEKSLVSLWDEAFPDNSPWNKPGEDIRRKLKIQRELFLVAVDGNKVIGSAMAGFDGHRGWVYYVAVRKDLRGKSIGRNLMDEIEVGLKKIGCTKLNLQVRSSNTEVVEFYRKLGYKIEDRVSMGKLLIDSK